jgi:hypothetical protein
MGYLRTFVFEISLLSTTAEMRKDDNQFRRHLQVRLGGGLQCQALCTDDGIGGSLESRFFFDTRKERQGIVGARPTGRQTLQGMFVKDALQCL